MSGLWLSYNSNSWLYAIVSLKIIVADFLESLPVIFQLVNISWRWTSM